MSKGEATREDMVHIFDELLDASDYAPYWWRWKYDYPKEDGTPIIPREKTDAIRALIEHGPKVEGPTIVCLCGSTRFMDAFFDAGWTETLAGKIVLSIGVCKHAEDHGGEALGPEVVRLLDDLHLRKIDLADEVFILNVGGYIGESTRNELDYAKKKGKKIRFLEPPEAGVEVEE